MNSNAYPGHLVPTSVPAQIQYRSIVAGGMPGWQITLIALGAALAAVAVTLLLAWGTGRPPGPLPQPTADARQCFPCVPDP
jgi:hypothetical protein